MRTLLPQFMFLLLLTSCNKHDEIVPVPPYSESTTTETPPQVEKEEREPPVGVDADYFQYGHFRHLPYRILLPRGFDAATRYPMVVFLHGIGERGSDNEKQLNIGASYFLRDSIRDKYPSFILYPQCPSDSYWFDKDMATLIKSLIDTLQQQYLINQERISIGGFSMGAYGTFELASRYPDLFEAAFPISGDGDESKATIMADVRWRIFAGQRDDVVPSVRSRKMAEALAKAGASVSFTLYPEADHNNTWVHVFSEPDLLDWLFATELPISVRNAMNPN